MLSSFDPKIIPLILLIGMFIDLFGHRGQGKSLKMVLEMIRAIHMKGRGLWKGKIVTNMEISDKIPHEPLNLKDVIDSKLENCIIFFDEPVLYGTDSRTSGSLLNRLWTYFVLQSRHVGVHCFYSMQYMTLVDVRIRSTTDVHIVCRKTPYRFIYRYYRPVTFIGAPVANMIGMQNFKTTYYWREELKQKGIYKLYNTHQKFDLNKILQEMHDVKAYIKEKEKSMGKPELPKKKLPQVPLGELKTTTTEADVSKQVIPESPFARDVELKPTIYDDSESNDEDDDLKGLDEF